MTSPGIHGHSDKRSSCIRIIMRRTLSHKVWQKIHLIFSQIFYDGLFFFVVFCVKNIFHPPFIAGTLTGKCWPAFQTQFGFVPCYVNSRLTAQGIPVSCEVDIYGTLSEFIGTVVSQDTVTLLDINNSVPKDMYKESIEGKYNYTLKDTFMGFHCGNTASSKLSFCEMKNQMIMARSLPVEVTNGTLEGDIVPGDITFYRLQSTADNKLRGYIAHGEVLPVATKSFGSIGVFAIPEMGRFYRHVLIEGGYPHHGAVAFGHYGKALFEVFKYIGVPVEEIGYNQPAGVRYPTENPWG